MGKNVVVIGAGAAGMAATARLRELGCDVTLVEKEKELGGHVREWYKVFPDLQEASKILDELKRELSGVKYRYNMTVTKIQGKAPNLKITTSDGNVVEAASILVTTGFKPFDASLKEEYGYGIYNNCITSIELDNMFKQHTLTTARGKTPKKIALVHCVGSRDEKVGNNYCSRVCCTNAIKSAIELRELYPESEVFCLYMDIRTYGRGYEELYRRSQEEMGVNFIRGRLSESNENPDGSLLLRVEDTLSGLPMKITVDLLVLMVGMLPGAPELTDILGLEIGEDHFFTTANLHTQSNKSNIPGIFLAGTATGPKTISEAITDARSAASEIAVYLKEV